MRNYNQETVRLCLTLRRAGSRVWTMNGCTRCHGLVTQERIPWTVLYQEVCVNCGDRREPHHTPLPYQRPQREPHGHRGKEAPRNHHGTR